MLRKEKLDGQKKRDDINDVKLKGLVSGLDATYRFHLLRAKSICAWMNVQCNTVTGTVLAEVHFSYNFPPPPLTSTANVADVAHPSIYVTHLAAENEASLMFVGYL